MNYTQNDQIVIRFKTYKYRLPSPYVHVTYYRTAIENSIQELEFEQFQIEFIHLMEDWKQD